MRRHAVVIGLIAAAVLIALLPLWLTPFYARVLQLFFSSAGLAIAWNILGGYAGYWSFGHTVFIGIGAFAAAIGANAFGPVGAGSWSMLLPVATATLVSALFAAVLAYPLLRLRGIYFAIAMLGVGQVVSELVNNIDWFQGGVGVFLAPAVPAGMRAELFYYYIFGALLIALLGLSHAVRVSRFGQGLIAIREDEDTAKMLGVPTEQYKIFAFVLSAALIGMLGAIYGYSLGYITTYSVFRVDFSLNMIVYCMIGGIGTLLGPVIGAAVMLVLTQVVLGHLLDLHLLVTGAVVVAIVLLAPNGFLGLVTARRAAAVSPREVEP